LVIHITEKYSTNCEQHQSNTRHNQEKYHLYAKTFKQAILSRFPIVKVYCKPITSSIDEFKKKISLNRNKPEQSSLIVDNYRPVLRIGAFEVQLFTRIRNELHQNLLHSKLLTRTWPNINSVLDKISKYIPHTNINVKVYTTATEAQNHPLLGII